MQVDKRAEHDDGAGGEQERKGGRDDEEVQGEQHQDQAEAEDAQKAPQPAGVHGQRGSARDPIASADRGRKRRPPDWPLRGRRRHLSGIQMHEIGAVEPDINDFLSSNNLFFAEIPGNCQAVRASG